MLRDLGCGALLTHFVDSGLSLHALANDGGAWPSPCQVASSAPASPCDFISAIKQFQWKIAVLAHKWARSQFSSSATFRPHLTQLVSIAVTPSTCISLIESDRSSRHRCIFLGCARFP